MDSQLVHPLVIIGSGPAGLTAGIYAARANLKPIIIEGKEPGGQLMGTTFVENWPGEKSILGPTLMMNMKEHAKQAGALFKNGIITTTKLNEKPFTLTTNTDEIIKTHSIIIATGATPKRLGIPGEDKYWGKGVTTCAVCDGAFYKDRPVVIVGGGDSAMEAASFMTRYTNDITIVQIHDKLSASMAMQKRVINNPAVKIIYNSTATCVEGNSSKVEQITIKNKHNSSETVLKTDALFIAIGLTPNTAIFKDQLDLQANGYLKLSNHTKTSVSGVFGAGDVSDYRYRQAVTSAGAGCMAALDAEHYLKELGI